MRFLPDTHILLWALEGSSRLPLAAAECLGKYENEVFFSSATIWEIGIKHGLNRPYFRVDPQSALDQLLENGYSHLPFTADHAILASRLPPIHKDPFDRMLIAQAICEHLTLITADETIAAYSGPILKV